MAYYRAVLRRNDKNDAGKYFPSVASIGRVTTEDLCDEIAEISTVSHADVVATLKALNRVIGNHLIQGQTVQLKGLCNIRLTAKTKGNGVDTPEEVSTKQIDGCRVVFTAERQGTSATGIGYALNLNRLRWQPFPGSKPGKDNETENGSENENNENNGGTGDNGNTGDNGSGDNGNNNGGGDGTED